MTNDRHYELTDQTRLRIDKTWRWATAIATGWGRLRTAFG